MKVLQTGIYNLVTALSGGLHNDFYNDISGKFYFGYAPQDSTFPFCVYHIINTAYDYEFREEFEESVVQFNICHKSPSSSTVGDIQAHLQTLFDWSSPTVTGYSVIQVERIFSTVDWYDDEGVWEIIIQYKFWLKKN